MATLAFLPVQRLSMSPRTAGGAWGAVAVTIWGVYLALARAHVVQGTTPSDLAFVRYTVAGLLMLPWLLCQSPGTMADIGWRRAGVLTWLAGPLFILVGASGFLFAPLSHGAVVQPAAVTVAGLALGALVLSDRITRNRAAGAAVILAALLWLRDPARWSAVSPHLVGTCCSFSPG